MTPEGRIRNLICSYLGSRGVFCFIHDSVGIYDPTKKCYRVNRSPYRLKGVSDILGIYNGRFLAIEVKTPKSYPTEEQKSFIEAVNRLGGIAFVARSIEDVDHGLRLKAREDTRAA